MTTFIREQETKEVLNKYREMSTQGLLDYLMSHHYDSDCQYIFNHLPKDLQNDLDALAGEMVKIRDKQIAERDQQIAEREQQIAERDQQIAEREQQIAEREQQIAEREQQIADVRKLTEYVDQQIADVQEFNKRLRAENYQIECEIDNIRDIRRQLAR
jgi:septal ring factor EnvC (AmiA/AmiB activator)